MALTCTPEHSVMKGILFDEMVIYAELAKTGVTDQKVLRYSNLFQLSFGFGNLPPFFWANLPGSNPIQFNPSPQPAIPWVPSVPSPCSSWAITSFGTTNSSVHSCATTWPCKRQKTITHLPNNSNPQTSTTINPNRDSDPNNPLLWFTIGSVFEMLKSYKEAIACYQQSLRLSPNSPEPWYPPLSFLASFPEQN